MFMRKLSLALVTTALAFAVMAITVSAAPPRSTFTVVLNAEQEVPRCAAATNASRGVATFRVVDEGSGTVAYRLVANNIPGATTAAHIHLAPRGTAGGVVQPLPFTPG